jgi:hypothetical protein
MSCGLTSEWRNNLTNSQITPMEIFALRWKVSTLRWKASNDSDGITKLLRWKITPHNIAVMHSQQCCCAKSTVTCGV